MPVEVADDPDQPLQRETGFVIETHSMPGYSGSPVFVRPFPEPKLDRSRPDLGYGANTNVFTYAVPTPDPSEREPRPWEAGRSGAVFEGPWLLGIQRAFIYYTALL